jgi:hypothetical protein
MTPPTGSDYDLANELHRESYRGGKSVKSSGQVSIYCQYSVWEAYAFKKVRATKLFPCRKFGPTSGRTYRHRRQQRSRPKILVLSATQ